MLLVEKIGFEDCKPDKSVVRLIYAVNTIHYVVKGHGYFNGVRLGPGEAFWTRKNRFVEYYPDRNDPWTYYWVHFNEDGFDAFLSDCGLPDCMYFRFSGYEQIIEFCRFYNSFPHPSTNQLLCKSTADLIRSLHSAENRTALSAGASYALSAREYIDNHYYHPTLSVQAVAQHLHISRCYLRDIFIRELGLSPREYITQLRIDRAKELLAAFDYPISTIAASVGYDDLFQFSRFFTAHVGCSPSEYRKTADKA